MEDFCVGINCSDLQIKISIKMETQNHFFRADPNGMLNTRGGHLIYIVFVAQDVSDAPKDNQIWISGDIDCKEANFLRWYNVIVFKCAQGLHLILIHLCPTLAEFSPYHQTHIQIMTFNLKRCQSYSPNIED